MIASLSTSPQPVFRDPIHRSTHSVPISPSSSTFRHSNTSSVSQLPLTPESPRFRPKYGNRMSDSAHQVTSPLLENDENELPVSRPRKPSSTYPLRNSEEREVVEQKELFPTIPATFPLSSPPASPPPPRRRSRPSLEGVFDTPTPKPRNSVVLTPPPTEPANRFPKERRLPRGENPFIFGKSSPRRTVRPPSESKLPPYPGALDTNVLQAPALNVTSPTPGPSPSKASTIFAVDTSPDHSMPPVGKLQLPSLEHSHAPKTVTYEDEVLSGKTSVRSRSKDGHEDDDGKAETLSAGGSRRISNTTSSTKPPSAFTAVRRNSRGGKGPSAGRTSPSYPPPDPEPLNNQPSNTTPERPRTTTPRPASRGASTRARSLFLDANSSRTSFPISAIVNPRPPSVARQPYDFIRREEGLYMRDPHREAIHIGWTVHVRGKKLEQIQDQEAGTLHLAEFQSPISGLLYYPGFLFPPLWWIGSFLRGEKFDAQSASKARWTSWRVQVAREQDLCASTWRNRCRFMALISLVTYLPVIVLLAIFIPR